VGSLLDPNMLFVIAALLLVVLVVTAIVRAVQIIPQATAAVVERLGRFKAVEEPGLVFLVPFVDKIRARIDLREQVRSFPPQPVITKDNLTVNIDTVVYYQVTNPKAAVYEIADYINGVEQTTTTTLRNVVGGLSLEETLTARDEINSQLRGELDKGVTDHAPLHTGALVGRGAVTVSRVDGHGGQVRIGGELWSARALDDHDVIEEGTPVTVMQISGATALVVAAG